MDPQGFSEMTPLIDQYSNRRSTVPHIIITGQVTFIGKKI